VQQAVISITSIPVTEITNFIMLLLLLRLRYLILTEENIQKSSPANYIPDGIPIFAEENLPDLIKKYKVNDCVFSYSDVTYQKVMSVSAIVNAAGANFVLLGPSDTMVKSTKPLIAVGAIRTGCGKSQTSRKVIELLMEKGLKVVAVRHPMPYGDLNAQKVQRFAVVKDLEKHKCTVEEMEEYEPHVVRGNVIYAGVDYEAILRAAENDPAGCDVVYGTAEIMIFLFTNQTL